MIDNMINHMGPASQSIVIKLCSIYQAGVYIDESGLVLHMFHERKTTADYEFLKC